MSFVLRALLLLAATTPLFVETDFHARWWQTLLAAAIGSAAGQLAVRIARGRRVIEIGIAVAALVVIAVPIARHVGRRTGPDAPHGSGLLVVRSRSSPTVTWDDVNQIRALASIERAVPSRRHAMQLIAGDANWNTQVVGTTSDFFDLMGLRVAAGERFDAAASTSTAKVVVLGETVATRLYGAAESAVGETVRIDRTPFTVSGVLAHRGLTDGGEDLDDIALIPIETYEAKIAGSTRFDGVVFVSATSPVEDAIRSLLRERHHLAPGADDDFVVRRAE